MSNESLDAIKARAEAATDGPWLVDPHADSENGAGICNESDAVIGGGMEGNYPCSPVGVYEEADAQFIAHARSDVPALVAAVQAVLAQHKCVESWRSGVYQCGHCAELCHSTSGLGCDDPIDAVWPCPTVAAIHQALGEGQ